MCLASGQKRTLKLCQPMKFIEEKQQLLSFLVSLTLLDRNHDSLVKQSDLPAPPLVERIILLKQHFTPYKQHNISILFSKQQEVSSIMQHCQLRLVILLKFLGLISTKLRNLSRFIYRYFIAQHSVIGTATHHSFFICMDFFSGS